MLLLEFCGEEIVCSYHPHEMSCVSWRKGFGQPYMVEDSIELLNIDFQFLVLVALAWASSSMVEVTLIQFSFFTCSILPSCILQNAFAGFIRIG